MKQRSYKDIKFIKNNDETLTLEHLTSEMTVPCSGGGYILPVPCGGGKSTGITSLIKLFPDEGFILFEKTIKECDEAYAKLVESGVDMADILVLHSQQHSNDIFKKDPDRITKARIVITPSVHLYTGSRATLFAYHPSKKVDIGMWINDVSSLLCSEYARRFILIDEQPDFIQPFLDYDLPNIISHYGDVNNEAKGSIIQVEPNYYIHRSPLDLMMVKYRMKARCNKTRFFKERTKVSDYKAQETISHIHSNFEDLCKSSNYKFQIWHYLKDLVSPNMKSNIYVFDATGAVLSSYAEKACPFTQILNKDKSYSSPIEFREFPMVVQRYLFEQKTDTKSLRSELNEVVDTLVDQINTVNGKLLIVTWKYMVSRSIGGESEDKQIMIMAIIAEELDKRGYNGRYSIIYRGSGEDKATNAYQDYAGVTFLGEWKTGRQTLSHLNKNYGIKCSELNMRLAAMIQTVCRVRIRQHNGDKIWIFYSNDIDKELISNLYTYFLNNTDDSCRIEGIALPTSNSRPLTFVEKIVTLCSYDNKLLDAISGGFSYTVNITLDHIYSLIPLKEKKSRSYMRSFGNRLYNEYAITLNIKSK